MDVGSCMAPKEDLPHQGDTIELFPQQQGEDLMGENIPDNPVMERWDAMKSTIQGCEINITRE